MKIDVFSEIERADLTRAGERQLIEDSLALARKADETGYGCWWQVEHHGAGEFSISSTPELFNTLVARETRELRIGHSGVLSPYGINHPLKVAARAGFLDIISGGRLEMGLARSSGNEWTNFGVDGDISRAQTSELARMLPRMWSEEKFSWESELITIPELSVCPKPIQDPHPPLWLTGTAPAAFEQAGGLGIGGIATTMLWPIQNIAGLIESYRGGIAACTDPAGDFVNDQFGCFTFVHCAETREKAIANRACEAALWYANHVPAVFNNPRGVMVEAIRGIHSPDLDSWRQHYGEKDEYAVDPDDPVPVIRMLNRQFLGQEVDPEEAYEILDPIDSVIIGDPDTCLAKLQKFADAGVDRLLSFQQFGGLRQEHVMASLELVGRELIPALDR